MGRDCVAESRHFGVLDAFKVVSADCLPGGQSKIKIFSGQVPPLSRGASTSWRRNRSELLTDDESDAGPQEFDGPQHLLMR